MKTNSKQGNIRAAATTQTMSVAEGHPRPWTKLPRNRRTKLAIMGIGSSILDKADPRYARALRLANKYRKVRAKELAVMHGHVSSGASALLASASLALAASRFLYEKVAETGDLTLIKLAASLADSARQGELAAWEMSAREGMVKRKMDAAGSAVPWLTDQSDTKAKPGRKTNAERQERAAMTIPETSQREATIDEILSEVVSKKEKSNGMASNRSGAVQVLQGVPGHASEPDGHAGALLRAIPEDSGVEAGTCGEAADAGEAHVNRAADESERGGDAEGLVNESATDGGDLRLAGKALFYQAGKVPVPAPGLNKDKDRELV